MLKSTFVHIPRVGAKTEKQLWQQNILNWDEFLDRHETLSLSPAKRIFMCSFLSQCYDAYDEKDHSFFSNALPENQHWRAYPDFKDRCCFLDIETTGLCKLRSKITTIGIYDGKESKVFVRGKDLSEFPDEIRKYSMIVTFNGRMFDIPFIKHNFKGIRLDQLHVDLRFVLRKLGYSGGLKRIEKEFGIDRGDLDGVDGFEAVRLWYQYKNGDDAALNRLIKYNILDVENLKVLMDISFEKLKEKEFQCNF